jgi:hypothetical protein
VLLILVHTGILYASRGTDDGRGSTARRRADGEKCIIAPAEESEEVCAWTAASLRVEQARSTRRRRREVSGSSAGARFSDTVTGNRLWMSRVRECHDQMRLYHIAGEPLRWDTVVGEGKEVLWREKALYLRYAHVVHMSQPNDLSYTSWPHLGTLRPRAMALVHTYVRATPNLSPNPVSVHRREKSRGLDRHCAARTLAPISLS